ncbi:methyltransferase domain-containing protein [Francisella philomiragia]|uniref:methyltransferase domain-containing protein n=1 Tax=Francisella philomiragia TaxID=28110 RepID=UPI001904F5E8|nr:methyltransferase domain-containing protein [Francisella philomiragia]MBK2297091.1 methyltransferase domain-containing protein [Francisella philomiragia]MBK2341337.1 methyltransferase domain-containing protein [Francisella philomiragia]
MDDKLFYTKFEDRFYAPRTTIKKLREQYLEFLRIVDGDNLTALDIGCGRGEWLEILRDQGFDGIGVDIDEGMLEPCRKLGLNVICADGFNYLENQDECSFDIITAFHVIEHITPELLKRFISNAYRSLKPGGLLLLETPNPENLLVSSNNFYIDPTHIRPVPSDYLLFLSEFYGFEYSKILRMQENKTLLRKEGVTITDILIGASPDYSLVAYKYPCNRQVEKINMLFDKKYGVSTIELSQRFDNKLMSIVSGFNLEAKSAEVANQRAEVSRQEVEVANQRAEVSRQEVEVANQRAEVSRQEVEVANQRAEVSRHEVEAANQRAEIINQNLIDLNDRYIETHYNLNCRISELEAANKHLDGRILLLYRSTSWRITRPVRLVKKILRKLKRLVFRALMLSKINNSSDTIVSDNSTSCIDQYWNIINESGLFDREYYLNTYPDVKEAGIDPIIHYLETGANEGRNPSSDFNTSYYLASYEDIDVNKINPFVHYVLHGASEARKPIPRRVIPIHELSENGLAFYKKFKNEIELRKVKK